MSTFGKAITTTAVSMSTNSAAIGMTITGSPIPVTDLAIDPIDDGRQHDRQLRPVHAEQSAGPPRPPSPSFHVCDKKLCERSVTKRFSLSQTWRRSRFGC